MLALTLKLMTASAVVAVRTLQSRPFSSLREIRLLMTRLEGTTQNPPPAGPWGRVGGHTFYGEKAQPNSEFGADQDVILREIQAVNR